MTNNATAPGSENRDVSIKILREIIEVHRYFNAPRMDVETFEFKFNALKLHADAEIEAREKEHGVTLR